MSIYLGAAVVDGALQFVSISQIEKYMECARRWGFRYVERRPEPKTPAQDKGIAFHERMDRYHKTGEKILTAMERPGLHLIYEPCDPLVPTEVEDLGTLRLGGVPVYLKIDLLNLRGDYLDEAGRRQPKVGHAEVQDYKTTGDVEAKAKTPRGLVETVQMPVYSEFAMQKVGGDQVRMSHVYFGTRVREAKKVTTLATRQEVADRLTDVDAVVREGMVPAARVARAVDLEPNWEACRWCPYTGICPKPASQVFTDLLGPEGEQIMQGFDPTAFLTQLTGAPAAAAPASTPAPPATAPAATQDEVARLEAQLAAAKAAKGNVTLTGQAAQDYAAKTNMGPIPQGSGIMTSAAAVQAAGVQPPDVPQSGATGPTAKAVPPEVVPTLPPAVQAVLATQIAPLPVPSAPPPAQTAPLPEAPPAEKPKRGRPRKAAEAPATPATIAEPGAASLELYVDCVAEGLEATSLAPYVEQLCEALCAQFKATDVRCAAEDTPLAFGKWKGVLASMTRACPPPAGAYTLLIEGSELRQVVAEALRGKCAVYVRGVR